MNIPGATNKLTARPGNQTLANWRSAAQNFGYISRKDKDGKDIAWKRLPKRGTPEYEEIRKYYLEKFQKKRTPDLPGVPDPVGDNKPPELNVESANKGMSDVSEQQGIDRDSKATAKEVEEEDRAEAVAEVAQGEEKNQETEGSGIKKTIKKKGRVKKGGKIDGHRIKKVAKGVKKFVTNPKTVNTLKDIGKIGVAAGKTAITKNPASLATAVADVAVGSIKRHRDRKKAKKATGSGIRANAKNPKPKKTVQFKKKITATQSPGVPSKGVKQTNFYDENPKAKPAGHVPASSNQQNIPPPTSGGEPAHKLANHCAVNAGKNKTDPRIDANTKSTSGGQIYNAPPMPTPPPKQSQPGVTPSLLRTPGRKSADRIDYAKLDGEKTKQNDPYRFTQENKVNDTAQDLINLTGTEQHLSSAPQTGQVEQNVTLRPPKLAGISGGRSSRNYTMLQSKIPVAKKPTRVGSGHVLNVRNRTQFGSRKPRIPRTWGQTRYGGAWKKDIIDDPFNMANKIVKKDGQFGGMTQNAPMRPTTLQDDQPATFQAHSNRFAGGGLYSAPYIVAADRYSPGQGFQAPKLITRNGPINTVGIYGNKQFPQARDYRQREYVQQISGHVDPMMAKIKSYYNMQLENPISLQ